MGVQLPQTAAKITYLPYSWWRKHSLQVKNRYRQRRKRNKWTVLILQWAEKTLRIRPLESEILTF